MEGLLSIPGRFGVFGKMPALGDFLRMGTQPGFVAVWDDWLQTTMRQARDMLGARFDDSYMRAPIWRFTLAPGLAGQGGALGVLMPSVDRVGRRFPLTIAAPLPARFSVPGTHCANDAVFRSLEDIALDALDDAMTRDALGARLARLGTLDLIPADAAVPSKAVPAIAAPGLRFALHGTGLCARLHARIQGDASPPHRLSLWSALGEDVGEMFMHEGLPEGTAAAALFDPALLAGQVA